MSKTELLKLVFHHDQRMEQLAPSSQESENPLAMFTQPDPTYSTLYFSGTLLEEEKFGLNTLSRFKAIIQVLADGLKSEKYQTATENYDNLFEAISEIEVNDMILIALEDIPDGLIHSFSGKVLRDVLEKGWIVIFKRDAQHGFDVQIFSKENIYLKFFHQLQALLESGFRFFSINGKRVQSEQFFYFETHRLDKPPHGFEEVFPESVL